ncbi:MAG: hypothetical protein AAFX81_03855 [Pseudomonadota bacterium]
MDPSAASTRERSGRLWTPPLPPNFGEALPTLDPSSVRLLWAAWCVPPRYRLAPHLWRQEARLQSGIVLRAKLRRLEAIGLLTVRHVTGPGLVFDGQHWRRCAGDRNGPFLVLRLTGTGEALLRRALVELA